MGEKYPNKNLVDGKSKFRNVVISHFHYSKSTVNLQRSLAVTEPTEKKKKNLCAA